MMTLIELFWQEIGSKQVLLITLTNLTGAVSHVITNTCVYMLFHVRMTSVKTIR